MLKGNCKCSRGFSFFFQGFTTQNAPSVHQATIFQNVLNVQCFYYTILTGTVDSNWVVGATLEKKLVPLPLTLALGAFLNHRKNKFQCGFGITIG